MANYVVDPELLASYLPNRTEIDLWKGTCYVSLVGFMFLNTRLMGFKIPFHTHFEEVNLRFYVRHKDGDQWKRGVVFIKEIVPRPALTFVANIVYKENYEKRRDGTPSRLKLLPHRSPSQPEVRKNSSRSTIGVMPELRTIGLHNMR